MLNKTCLFSKDQFLLKYLLLGRLLGHILGNLHEQSGGVQPDYHHKASLALKIYYKSQIKNIVITN